MSTNEQLTGGRVPEWTISDRLRKAREASGLSQKDLAAKASISLRTISNYENPDYDKERKRPFVVAWGLATGWSVEWLWTGVEPDDGGPGTPSDLPGQSSPCMTDVIDLASRRGVEWGGRTAAAA